MFSQQYLKTLCKLSGARAIYTTAEHVKAAEEVGIPVIVYGGELGVQGQLDLHAVAHERVLFDLLITVKNVGPSTAIAILSGSNPRDIATLIANEDVAGLLRIKGVGKVNEAYRAKDVDFPVKVGMQNFMSEKPQQGGGQRFDREGLFRWAVQRLGPVLAIKQCGAEALKDEAGFFNAAVKALATEGLTEEVFRTEPRSKLRPERSGRRL